MLVSDISLKSYREYSQLDAKISWSAICRHDFRLWFRFPSVYAKFVSADNGDPFVAACLAPAMAIGEPLQIECGVSSRLLKSAERIQDIYHGWHQSLAKIPLRAWRRRPRPNRQQSRMGLFFSLGVDSFYSLLKHQHEVSHLLLVHGFDMPLDEQGNELFRTVRRRVQDVADGVGAQVLPVTTNLRALSNGYVDWGATYHGGALCSVGLLFQGLFSQVGLAASYSHGNLFPWGSHPLLDPRWSTEDVSFVHDGCEAGRLDKVRCIARSALALKHLRVCYKNPKNAYNCGRCVKCVRTMVGLHIAGVLGDCETFQCPLDVGAVRRLSAKSEIDRRFLLELIHELSECKSTDDQQLQHALRSVVGQSGEALAASSAQDAMQVAVQRKFETAVDLATILSGDETIILVDQEKLVGSIHSDLRVFPFPERDGRYNGLPANSEVAILELERLRDLGANIIIFAWPSLWWLDYYHGFNDYLRDNYESVLRNERLAVFDLRTNKIRQQSFVTSGSRKTQRP